MTSYISVWVGRPGGPPRHAQDPDRLHGAASTMKVAVLAALYRAGGLDEPVPVVNDFASALETARGTTTTAPTTMTTRSGRTSAPRCPPGGWPAG